MLYEFADRIQGLLGWQIARLPRWFVGADKESFYRQEATADSVLTG